MGVNNVYSIDIIFTAENEPDFVSRAIISYLKAPYSHVLIVFKDMDQKRKIFHAVPRGVCIDEGVDKYFRTHEAVFRYTIPLTVTRPYFCGYAYGSTGKEYSWAQYWNFLFGTAVMRNGKQERICSETVGVVMNEMSDVKLEGNVDMWDPKFLQLALEEYSTKL